MRRLDSHLFTITYDLFPALVGLTGIEPVTSSLSGTRSNQLSYKPIVYLWKRNGTVAAVQRLSPFLHGSSRSDGGCLLRKEVIQPLVPPRLPCYDFIPITTHTLDGSPLADGPPASGADGFHDVTGGVYKARERIHGTNC